MDFKFYTMHGGNVATSVDSKNPRYLNFGEFKDECQIKLNDMYGTR